MGRVIKERSRVNWYSRKVGHKITPYDLRHSFTIMYLRNSGNIFARSGLLRHATLSMTKR